MRLFFRRATKNNEALKQDQSCILAQNFSSCRNLRLEFFRESLFRTATHLLSSTARVNAAQNVHSHTKLNYRKINLSRKIVRREKVLERTVKVCDVQKHRSLPRSLGRVLMSDEHGCLMKTDRLKRCHAVSR